MSPLRVVRALYQRGSRPPTEFKVLYALALDAGRVITRDELLRKISGRRCSYRDRTIDVCVKRLRDKVDRRTSVDTFIQTHFGVGYKLAPEAES